MQIDNYTLDGEDEQLLELLDDSEMDSSLDETAVNSLLDDNDMDSLLDDTDEEPVAATDVQESSLFEYDYGDGDVGRDIHMSILPEDLNRFDVDEEDVDEDDEEILTSLKDILSTKGYTHLDLYDYDQLNRMLSDDEKFCDATTVQQVKENFINSFAEICDSIKASKATLSAAGVTSSDISWDKPTAPAILDNELTDVLWDHILELVIRTGNQNGDFHEITYNKVIETIYDRLSSAAQMALMEAESYPYVLTCISAAIKSYKDIAITRKALDEQRSKVTSYLLREDKLAIQTIKNKKCSVAKQVFVKNGQYFFRCDNCGTESKVPEAIVSYIVYDAESAHKPKVIPRLLECSSCGEAHLLPITWYAAIKKKLDADYKTGTDELLKHLSKIATGTAISRIIPGARSVFSDIETVIDISEKEDVTASNVPVSKVKELAALTITSDPEYRKAIKCFRDRLVGFASSNKSSAQLADELLNSLSSSKQEVKALTTKELAKCIASSLSLDYLTEKNKALYSLVLTLDEYDSVRSCMCFTEIVYNLNKAEFLSLLDEPESKIKESSKELISLYKDVYGEKEEDFNKVIAGLKEYRSSLLASVEDYKTRHKVFVEILSNYKDLFSNTKILNIKQINYELLHSYLCDCELISLFDEITDRMIINNHAEQYAVVLFKDSAIRKKNNLKTLLLDSSNGDAIESAVAKVLESINIELPNYSSRCLQYVSANHLSALRTAASYFKHNEYYNFVTALIEFNADSTLIDQKADDLLEALCNFVMLEAKDVQQKSYCEYYLSDFSEAEIASLDSSYRTKMMEITFGRFVPRRLNGESLPEYLDRYIELEEQDFLSTVPHYDYREKFSKFTEYVPVILAGANVLGLEYDNFVLADFVRILLNACCFVFTRKTALFLLRYNESFIARVCKNMQYEFTADAFKDNSNLLRVLHVDYHTSLGNFIQPYADKCSNETLNEHSDVPKYKIVSFGDIVSDYGFLTDSDFIQMENAFLANKAKTDKNAEMPTLSADDIVQVRDIVSDEYEHYFERALL